MRTRHQSRPIRELVRGIGRLHVNHRRRNQRRARRHRRAGRIEILAAIAPVRAQRVDARDADRHEALLVALADHAQLPRRPDLAVGRMQLERGSRDRGRLGDAQARVAHQQQQRAGGPPRRSTQRGSRGCAPTSRTAAPARSAACARLTGYGSVTAAHGIAGQVAHPDQPLERRAQRAHAYSWLSSDKPPGAKAACGRTCRRRRPAERVGWRGEKRLVRVAILAPQQRPRDAALDDRPLAGSARARGGTRAGSRPGWRSGSGAHARPQGRAVRRCTGTRACGSRPARRTADVARRAARAGQAGRAPARWPSPRRRAERSCRRRRRPARRSCRRAGAATHATGTR